MKIIASDYDGTINVGGISEKDRDAIAKFRKAGNKFGIVTGRDLEMALWVMHDLKKFKTEVDFLICCTGAIILTGEGEPLKIKKSPVTPEFDTIIKKALELGFGSFNINDELKKYFIDSNGKIPYDISEMSSFTQLNVWFTDDKNAEKFAEFMKSYSGIISAYRNGGSVDMPPPNTSKVTGIYDYSAQFENPEIFAVGDNLNDLPMIEEFCSFAVSNAQPQVKAAATYQCDRIADMIDFIMEEK